MGKGTLTLHRARFAKHNELRELLSSTPCPDSVLLGTNRQFLFFKRYAAVRPTSTRREIGNTLIVGPTRSGKGLLAISQLLSWKHSVIVNDIKGELFAATAGYRSTLGNVYVVDPAGYGHCYDPLLRKHTEDDLYSSASQLLFQADERDRVFTDRATGMLSRLFAAARIEQVAPLPYVRLLIRSGLRKAAERLNRLDPTLATQFLYVDYQDANFENKFLLSSWETLIARLTPLLTETVVRSLTHSDFTPEQMMRGGKPVTVYLRWKEQDLLAHSPLVRLLWGSLINELTTTYDTNQGEGCRPVLLLIDEAGRTAIPMLADQATTVVGRGISLWIAIQSLSQLETVYGRARAQVLRDNMESQMYYRPIDLATAQHLQDRLGKYSAYAHSTTERGGAETSIGETEQPIPLLTAQEIMQLRDEEIICFHRRLPPFKLDRMDWRNHPFLHARRNIPAPKIVILPRLSDTPIQDSNDVALDLIDPDMIHEDEKEEEVRLN
jgi:type IV secretion system protein VirD4